MFIQKYNFTIAKNRCAKQVVIAVLIAEDGEKFIGTNSCNTPQQECPRKAMASGEGYRLCRDICNQKSHAEVSALDKAGYKSFGATIFLYGHNYCCDNCISKMKEAGIKEVIIIA